MTTYGPKLLVMFLLCCLYVPAQQLTTLHLRGIVRDSRSRRTISGARVSVAGGLAKQDSHTDSEGFFDLPLLPKVRTGDPVTVRVEKEGYAPFDLAVPASEAVPLQIAIDPMNPPKPKSSQGTSKQAPTPQTDSLPKGFSYQQIADYSNSVTLAISNDSTRTATAAIGSGFWVSQSGYVISCTRKLIGAVPGNSLLVGTLLPLSELRGKAITGGGVAYRGGDFVFYDRDSTGIVLLWVEENPFHRDTRAVTFLEDTDTHKSKVVVEQAAVPVISDKDAKVGDTIYLLGVENNNGLPGVSTLRGSVERVGIDATSSPARALRIYTSIPFKNTYWGAPVLNESEEVIGVVGDSESDAVVIPSRYILEILRDHHIR